MNETTDRRFSDKVVIPSTFPWEMARTPSGYAWWYADLVGEAYALSVIFFAGSVFSPYYGARVRKGEPVCGLDYPAIHLQVTDLTRRTQPCWVMNEHPRSALAELPGGIGVGESRFVKDPSGVTVEIDEVTTRFFARPGVLVKGVVRLSPLCAELPVVCLGPNGVPKEEAHYWSPVYPSCEGQVDLTIGGERLQFTGLGYHDRNFGGGRLERAFSHWTWGHGHRLSDGTDALLYRVVRRADGHTDNHGLIIDGRGQVTRADDLTLSEQPSGTLLSAPFYRRFRTSIHRDGQEPFLGVGEELNLQRFSVPALQFLLRYKTLRRCGDDSLFGFLYE